MRTAAATVALALTAPLAACSSLTGDISPSPTATAASSSASPGGVVVPSEVPTAPAGATIENHDGSDQTPASGGPLVLDEAAKASAVAAGTKVMRQFARRNVPASTWWRDLSPLLTAQAQQAYQGTDPRNVLPTKVTGDATLTPASKAQAARVSVPTDVGVYLVILARTPDQPTWLADRIMPPENIGEQ